MHLVKTHKNIKFQISTKLRLTTFRFEKNDYVTIEPWFVSETKSILHHSRISKSLKQSKSEIRAHLDVFCMKAAIGW